MHNTLKIRCYLFSHSLTFISSTTNKERKKTDTVQKHTRFSPKSIKYLCMNKKKEKNGKNMEIVNILTQ